MSVTWESKGYWWLPEVNKKVAGTIIFDTDKGIILDLFGKLTDDIDFCYKNCEIINGQLHNGVLITLFDSFDLKDIFLLKIMYQQVIFNK